jgi:signal transduction histidine kinase
MDAETVREFVGDIGQEAERLSRITEDLLRLTRIDSGNIEQAVAVETAPVLLRVERMLRMGETLASYGYTRNVGGKGFNQAIALSRAGADVCFAGEIGLSGEIRPVAQTERRIIEASRLGFKRIYVSSFSSLEGLAGQADAIEVIKVADVPALCRSLFKN